MEEKEEQAIQLPPKYYLTYFEYMLGFVESKYESILNASERVFLEKFKQLSEDAKCLYIRLSNRRGRFFKWSSLQYDEIEDLEHAFQELVENTLVGGVPQQGDQQTYTSLLALFTKAELLTIARQLALETAPLASIKRADLVRWLVFTYSYEQFITHIHERIICVDGEEEVVMFKFLFFGNRYNDMSEFVIRDLGHVRFQTYEEQQLSTQFETRKEVEDRFMLSLQTEVFETSKKELPPEEVYDWFMNWQGTVRDHLEPIALLSFEKLALKIAVWLEKSRLLEQALVVYELTTIPPARERRIRILQKLGLLDEAKALAELLQDHPQNAEEKYFASDFLAKQQKSKTKIIKSTTRLLKDARVIEIDSSFRQRVELGVAQYYMAQGYEAVFSENEPWRALFGLVFWDIIYDMNVQAIHHPLQRVPSDFFQPDFYWKRKEQMEARLASISNCQELNQLLQDQWDSKWGLTNVLVGWYDSILSTALQLVALVPLVHLKVILMQMALNLRENTRGFPDLLIWNTDSYQLIEVKSPTDHLSARQLYWLELFQEMEIPSQVIRVVWSEIEETKVPEVE